MDWNSFAIGAAIGLLVTLSLFCSLATWLLNQTLVQMRNSGEIVDSCLGMVARLLDERDKEG